MTGGPYRGRPVSKPAAVFEAGRPLQPRFKTMAKDAPGSPADRTGIAPRSPRETARSRVTNHQDLLPGLDGRSSAARRFRDLVSAFVADMGGLDQCSEIKLALLRRLAACTVQAELLEAKVVGGEPVNVSELCTLASTALRLSARVGIERVSKDVTPSLADYLAENYPPDEADEAANHEGEDQ